MTPADSAIASSLEATAAAALRELPYDELELGPRVADAFAQATPAA